ncbi:beta-1,3-galactosyltransferase 5-like [Maniola jurtina]|uniref:beta-1,3-galactosyltransferase 5-like n=1 Tax=Maniola jurtina TaxID=191418 RepID=UPI001E6871F4|nr:beta-1,3-galactosyltransferase 5-like [Maniola jurtina]
MGAIGAGGVLRRSHAAALATLTALLLLLLARHAPAPPPRPRPAHADPLRTDALPPSQPLLDTTNIQPSKIEASKIESTVRIVPPARTSVRNVTAAPSAAPTAARRDPRVVLTRDMYVAGHERPHPELCPALGAHLRLLILVTSAPSHSTARDAVRLTWGHYAARRDVALAFVLGSPPDSMRPALENEDALYGDLIVGRSLDSYSNLTLKTLSMLEWTDTYCPRVPRLLKTDDDMFINVPRLLRFVASHVNATRTIWGKVVRKSLPKRTTKSKYYVSPLQFPGKVFPDFATGPAYLLTSDTIRPLLEAAPSEPYLRLEDVFITGVLGARLGLKRQHAAEFYNKKVAAHPCAVQRGIAIHMVQYHEQFDLWRKLLDGKTKCAS